MTIFSIGFWDVHWFWQHWKTWYFEHVEYESGGGLFVLYLGCLCIAKHYLDEPE